MMNSLRTFFAVVGIALLPFSVFAESQIKIGAILPLTGELAPFGEIVRGGISSASLSSASIIYEDDGCLPQKAVAAYTRLTSVEHVNLFLGPCCTTSVAALAPLIKRNNHVAMNFCTGSEDIHELSGGNIFHSQYSAQAEATFNAHSMWNLGVRRPIIIFQESEFGRAHDKAFRSSFPGGDVTTLSYSGADREQLKSLVLKLRSQDFDALYVPLVETFLLGLMTEMNRAGIKGKRIFGIYSVQLPALIEAEGANVEGVIYSYPDIPTSKNAAEYFASLAAEMLEHEAVKCGADNDCIKHGLIADYHFDSYGFLPRRLLLKTINGGKFDVFSKQ